MSDTKQTTLTDNDLAWAKAIAPWLAIQAIQKIESCRNAIRQYAEAGLSGTEHDIEHREMLAKALDDFRRAVP